MSDDFGTATVESLEANGSFDGKYGTMYCFWVVLDNGVKGEALAKGKSPPYKVGDEVEYEIAGTNKQGDPKLKVKRPGADGGGGNAGSRPSGNRGGSNYGSRSQGSGKPSGNDYAVSQEKSRAGQRIGMCVQQAVAIALGAGVNRPGEEPFFVEVWKHASRLHAMCEALEAGKFAPPPKHEPANRSEPTGDPEPY